VERRALAALAILLLLPGCTQPGSSAQVAESQRESLFHAPANLEELTDQLREASYQIDCGTSYGSGFGYSTYSGEQKYDFIITTKSVLTNCLNSKTDPVFIDSDGNTYSAEVMASSKTSGTAEDFAVNEDFAILKPAKTKFATFDSDADSYQIGSWVMTGSFPELNTDYNTWTVAHGILSSNLMNLGYAISTPTHPGSNGGVVINSKGQVVGIRYSPTNNSLQDLSYILQIDQATTLLNEVMEQLAELEVEPRLG
jgi:S1-C subfamily serine protease